MKTVFCGVNSKFIHTCLSAHILINHIDKKISDTVLLEYSINDNIDIVLKSLYEQAADVYLFSVYIFNVEIVKRIISKLKKILPYSVIILGGPEVSFDADKFLINNPSADIIVLGEGERTLNNLLAALAGNSDLRNVNNIAFKKGDKAEFTKRDDVLLNMDDIIFPYNEYNIKHFKNKIIYYESSRGCPYRCAYCMSANEKHLRYRSLDKVLIELMFFISHKVPIVKFTDRTFNADSMRAQRIWQIIMDNNICTTFHFEIAADILSEDNLALLKQMPSGFIQLEIGIQSIKAQTLLSVNRKCDLDKLQYNITELTKKDNIHIHTDLIAGLPYESYNEFKKSFNFVYSLNSHMIQLGFLKILKGSPMADMAEEYQYCYDEYAPYEIIKNKWISYDEILKLKAAESIIDKYHNSQSFKNILTYLKDYYKNNVFELFEQIGEFFNINGVFNKNLSKVELYSLLVSFLKHKNLYNKLAKSLIAFDFILNNSCRFPQEFSIEKVTKNKLYDVIHANTSAIPEIYKDLSYKQLIKHVNVFEFEINPVNYETKKTYIALWDIKQNDAKKQSYYAILR